MDLVTLAAAKKAASSGSSVEISTSIATDGDLNTKAASPKAVKDFVEGKGYLTEHQSLADYATKNEISGKADAAAVDTALAAKANAADVTAQIAAAVGSITRFEYYLCGAGEYDAQTGEPTVQGADTNHIYLVPTSGSNLNMYSYIDDAFVFLGTTEVDLSGYATTAAMNTALAAKADTADIPTVPTNVSAFTNDAGYITNPRTVLWSATPDSESTMLPNYIGGVQTAYVHSREATEQEVSALRTAGAITGSVYLNTDALEMEHRLSASGEATFGCNLMETQTDAPMGIDIVDPTKPLFVILMGQEEESASGYSLTIISTEHLDGTPLSLFTQQNYLTEHQSLAEYTKTAGFHQVAFSGSYNHLNNKPTIPTVPGNLVTGSASAYLIVVSGSAPAANTANNVITIVVP